MCTEKLPPVGYPIAVKYIISVILSLMSPAIHCVFICMLSHFRLYKRYLFWPGSGKCPLQTPALSLTILIAVHRGFLGRAIQTQKQLPTLNQTCFLLRPFPIFRSLIISSSWLFFQELQTERDQHSSGFIEQFNLLEFHYIYVGCVYSHVVYKSVSLSLATRNVYVFAWITTYQLDYQFF
jgi:hypothetical protein